ncbi:F-box only protein 50 [Apodemus speciosus]|uniref:F-box only protein 50 n=1 Tax=Apodemus speciosus TaxID=105296 RepID=A0ABQ0EX65_APOSI
MAGPAPPPPVNLDPRDHDLVAQALRMEKTPDRDALSGRMEAEGSQNSEELPPYPQSLPPPPSPRPPTSPVTPKHPHPNAPTEVEARQLLVEEWGPLSRKLERPLPPGLAGSCCSWSGHTTSTCSAPEPRSSGINIYQPAPPPGPTRKPLKELGWAVKEQCVNLPAKKLWGELLDDEQFDITTMDWFEDSRLDQCVYELHVWLLVTDYSMVIAQHHVAPRTNGRGPPPPLPVAGFRG